MTDPVRDLFKRHVVQLDRDDTWLVQGKPVVRHQAVERLGAALNIEWMPPQILRAERDEAVILATGKVGDKLEWSIGEALIVKEGLPGGNYKVSGKQAAYPFAMAEKRARDRVILKLAGLQGVYSEEEADDFKSRDPEPSNAGERQDSHPAADSVQLYIDKSRRYIDNETRVANLKAWWLREADIRADFGLVEGDTRHDLLKSFFIEKGKKLSAASVIRGPEAEPDYSREPSYQRQMDVGP